MLKNKKMCADFQRIARQSAQLIQVLKEPGLHVNRKSFCNWVTKWFPEIWQSCLIRMIKSKSWSRSEQGQQIAMSTIRALRCWWKVTR